MTDHIYKKKNTNKSKVRPQAILCSENSFKSGILILPDYLFLYKIK